MVMNKITKILLFILIICFTIYWFYQMYCYIVLPRNPLPEINRIFPINIHGATIYLTYYEYEFSTWLQFLIFFILFPIFFAVLAIERYREKDWPFK